MQVPQLLLLVSEAAAMAAITLGLFRLRTVLGLTPLYIVLGGFQYLEATLNLKIELLPGFVINPGSTILFTSTLSTVMLVYLKEDAIEARKLAYGLVLANVAVSLIVLLLGWHLATPGATSSSMSAHDLRTSGRIAMIGTTLLFFDVLGIILLYEFVSRFVTGLFARFFISIATVAAIDNALFTLLIQYSSPNFGQLLRAGLIGKTVASLFNAMVYAAYLRFVETQRAAVGTGDVGDVFQALTYRQKYEQARQRMTRDALTGLFNRGYFDEALHTAIEHARRYNEPVSLLLIDTDHFKDINDQFFHVEGDRALRLIGRTLSEMSRAADVPCRFGGDEFVVILSHTPHAEAILFAERIRAGLRDRCHSADPPYPWAEVTTTIGVATYPSDANVRTPEDLLRIADERLYAGKQAGRNRISAAVRAPDRRRVVALMLMRWPTG